MDHHSYRDFSFDLEGCGKGGAGAFQGPDEAPDSLRSKAFAKVLHLVSEGPVDGFCDENGNLIKDAKVKNDIFRINSSTGAIEWIDDADVQTKLNVSTGRLDYILEPGYGYPANSVIKCKIYGSTSSGFEAVVQAVTNNFGEVTELRIGANGSGYADPNSITVVFSGGIRSDGTHAVATIEEGDIDEEQKRIISVTLDENLRGSNYFTAPEVTFVDATGAGTGAYGVGVVAEDGTISGVTIKSGGLDYSFDNNPSNFVNIQPYPVTGRAIKLDGIPLQTPSLEFNFKEVEVGYSLGTARQDVIPGFETVETSVENLNASFLDDNTAANGGSHFTTFTITEPTTSRVRINILIDALLKQNKANGDIEPTSLEFVITYDYYASNGDLPADSSGVVGTHAFGSTGGVFRLNNKKTSSQYEMSLEENVFKKDGYKNHKWVFKVVRNTPDRNYVTEGGNRDINDEYMYRDSFKVSSAFSVSDTRLMYPFCFVVGITINAEQFSRLPTVSFRARFLQMLVPSNYFPPGTVRKSGTFAGQTRITGEYNRGPNGEEYYKNSGEDPLEQPWDGTFYKSWTNNAAWVPYNLCVNRVNGVGAYISNVNKWLFYKVGKYCDGLVSNGYGGLEPRFTVNTYIQTQADALRVLQDFASVFRGVLMILEGSVIPINDAPQEPVFIFNTANIEGDFQYVGIPLSDRHTSAIVRYNNRNIEGKYDFVLVEDYEAILKYGIRPVELTAFGVMSRGQAFRAGRVALFSENYETDIVSFVSGAIARTLYPGMVIGVADPAKSGVDYSGRIKETGVNGAGNSVLYCDRFEEIVDLDGNGIDAAEFKASSFSISLIDPEAQYKLTEFETEAELNSYARSMIRKFPILSFGKDFDGHQIVTINGLVSDTVSPGTIYAIERTEVKVRQFKILSIEAVDGSRGQSWQITAGEFQSNKFGTIEKGIEFEEIPTSFDLADWHLPGPPRDLIVTVRNIEDVENGTEKYVINADWQVPSRGYIVGYEVSMRRNLGNWVKVGEVTSTQFEQEVSIVDTYCVRVRSIGIGRSTSTSVSDCAEVVPTTDIDGDGEDDILVPGDGEGDIPGAPGTPRVATGITWRTFERVSGLEIENKASTGYWDEDDEVFKHSFDTKDVVFEWRANNPRAFEFGGSGRFGAESGDLSSDFRDYLVSIYDPNSIGGAVYTAKTGRISRFAFNYSLNSGLAGGPYRDFIIGVQAQTASRISKEKTMRCAIPGPAKLQVAFGTPPDETYVVATVTDDGQIQFAFPETDTINSKGFRVWLDTVTIGATPPSTTFKIQDSINRTMSIGLLTHDTTYYFRVAELDDFGPGEISDQYSFQASNPDKMDAISATGL